MLSGIITEKIEACYDAYYSKTKLSAYQFVCGFFEHQNKFRTLIKIQFLYGEHVLKTGGDFKIVCLIKMKFLYDICYPKIFLDI